MMPAPGAPASESRLHQSRDPELCLARIPSRHAPSPVRSNGVPCFVVGANEVEVRLQVEPGLRLDAEPVPEAQGRVAGNRTLGVDDLTDPIGRYVYLPREFRRREPSSTPVRPSIPGRDEWLVSTRAALLHEW